eukprot:978693-Rhodomonas_salina.1
MAAEYAVHATEITSSAMTSVHIVGIVVVSKLRGRIRDGDEDGVEVDEPGAREPITRGGDS